MIERPAGATLLELLCTLSILTLLVGMAMPSLRSGGDRFAARGARDALAAGIVRVRASAIARGGAELVVDVAGAGFWIQSLRGDTIGHPVDLAAEYGVRLSVEGAAGDRVTLRFDGLGIGRLVNRTFRLSRGRAEAHLTLSAYGRARPW